MKRRIPYRIPQKGRGWAGEDSIDGWTDEIFGAGFLTECRNYQLQGRGRLLKRQGTQPYVAGAVDGSSIVQGMGVYDFLSTRHLLVQAGSKVKKYDGTSAWDDITGSVAPTAGVNVLTRMSQYHDGTNGNVMGANNSSPPWYWPGSGNALALPVNPEGTSRASDVASFKEHVFAIYTHDSPITTRYSNTGVITQWPDLNKFVCSSESEGVALSLHNNDCLIAGHAKSVHAIRWIDGSQGGMSEFFSQNMIDGSRGFASRTGVATYKGITYFVANDGVYRIRRTDRPAEYISRSQEGFWGLLNAGRKQYITAVASGEPWNVIYFLVSTGSNTQHNAIMVYNPMIASIYGEDAGWTVFESAAGYLKYNHGVNWTDSDGIDRTLLGGYDGVVDEAFGTGNSSSGYLDNGPSGAAVESILWTGAMDFGYDGMKGMRYAVLDLVTPTEKTFTLRITSINESISQSRDVNAGSGEALLDDDFMVDASYLSSSGISSAGFKVEGDSRRFRTYLYENSTTAPHQINALTYYYKRKRMGAD